MLAYCVMGDSIDPEEKTFTTFDGEFEGITPFVEHRQP